MFKAYFTGNLVADPQLSDKAKCCNFTVAARTSHMIDGQPKTEFVRVTVWGSRGENAAKHLKKGDPVVITTGDFYTNEYRTREGEPRTALCLASADWDFARGNGRSEANTSSADDNDDSDMFDED